MELNLLSKNFTVKLDQSLPEKRIWDLIRKKWVVFTPEEMVRQLYIQYLLIEKKIPLSRIAVEKEIKLSRKSKRCDIILYDHQVIPKVIIECKSPDIQLDHKVVSQVVRYNQALEAPYLCITNGLVHQFFNKNHNGFWQQIDEIDFDSIQKE